MNNYDIEKELVRSVIPILERAAKILRERHDCGHGHHARGINYGILSVAREAEHCCWMMEKDEDENS